MAKKIKFEDSLNLIEIEIAKRRRKWNLTAINWMDFNDVAQIIRFHIYKKWHLYNQKKPLGPWVNRIISNQIKNLIRNNYSNFTRPCLKCSAAEGDTGCSIYGKQCEDCPLFANWKKNKENAFNTKITLSLENHAKEINLIKFENLNIDFAAKNIHKKMSETLKPVEWKVYKYLYMEGKNEEQVASLMGYRTSEHNRKAGYKQIRNLKKSIMIKVKRYLYSGEIDV